MSHFCFFFGQKMEFRTYFVYFNTFSYKVPTNSHRVWDACGECQQQISVGDAVRKEILSRQYDSSIVFLRVNKRHQRVRIIKPNGEQVIVSSLYTQRWK